jgi:hypothetical protein
MGVDRDDRRPELIQGIGRFEDPNGSLVVFDETSLPFRVIRVFFVEAPVGSLRGEHAHRVGRQILIAASGRIEVTTHDCLGDTQFFELEPGMGLLLPAMVWANQRFVHAGSVLAVLCDTAYEEGDYIRTKDEFFLLRQQSLAKRAN